MADGGDRWREVGEGRPPAQKLADGLRANRHLRARCRCCGRREPFTPDPSLLRSLGNVLLLDLADRFRCVCGARQATLEVWIGPAAPMGDRAPRIFLFR